MPLASEAFIEKALNSLSDSPVVLGLTIVGCVFVWRSPSIIKAFGHVIRQDRKNRLEVASRRDVLRAQLEKAKKRSTGAKR